MYVDVILLIRSGLIEEQHVLVHTVEAEKTFNDICETLHKDKILSDEDVEKLTEEEEYSERLNNVNDIIKTLGHEIIWLPELEVNEAR